MRFALLFLLVLSMSGCGAPKIERNTPLDVAHVPPQVLQAAKKRFPDVTFKAALKTPGGDFELSGKNKVGKQHELVVTPSGEIIEAE